MMAVRSTAGVAVRRRVRGLVAGAEAAPVGDVGRGPGSGGLRFMGGASSALLLAADYKQLEMRLFAAFSHDPTLQRELAHHGDLFVRVAAAWHRKDAAAVSADERAKTKQLCYGLLYGMGAEKLGAGLGVRQPNARPVPAQAQRPVLHGAAELEDRGRGAGLKQRRLVGVRDGEARYGRRGVLQRHERRVGRRDDAPWRRP